MDAPEPADLLCPDDLAKMVERACFELGGGAEPEMGRVNQNAHAALTGYGLVAEVDGLSALWEALSMLSREPLHLLAYLAIAHYANDTGLLSDVDTTDLTGSGE